VQISEPADAMCINLPCLAASPRKNRLMQVRACLGCRKAVLHT